MNKKGFTMIELLAAIVILGILSVLAIVGVSNLIEKSKKEDRIQQKNTLEMAAESYYSSNRSELPKEIGKKKVITAAYLKSKKYLKEDIKDKNGKSCMGIDETYVEVYKKSTTEYTYKPIICGEKEENKDIAEPTAEIYLTDSTDATGKSVYKNVQTAKIIIRLNGGVKKKSGKAVAIDGYTFSILAKKGEGEFREVYNSGTKSGENKNQIDITENITKYIDVSGITELYAEVEVINKDGKEKKATTKNQAGKYHDQDNPKCNGLSTVPVGANDWINKENGGRRNITMKCDDGYGSGCKREEFTRSWPNQENEYGAEWGYIQVEDNVGRTSIPESYIKGDSGSMCDSKFTTNDCRVRVNVDIKTPTIVVRETPLKSQVTADNKNESVNIAYTSYKNNVNNWLNKENYPNGIEFTVDISDNIRLAKYTWEVNNSNETTTVANKNIKFNSKSSEVKTKTYENSDKSINCGILSDTIKIGFKDEGKRQGKLTVYDKAGNKTTVYITAYLDRTAPTVPTTNMKKWKDNKTRPTSEKGLGNYANDTWSKEKVFTYPSNSKDTMSGFSYYQYTTTGKTKNSKDTKDTNRNIEAEGISYIKWRAYDIAGNPSAYNSNKTIKVDYSPPTVPGVNMYKWSGKTAPTNSKSGVRGTYTNNTWFSGKVYTEHTISTDSYSGNEKIGDKTKIYYQYTTTGKTTNNTNKTAAYRNVEAEGVSYIKWRSCDPLGNCSAYSGTKTIKLDRTNPSCSISKSNTWKTGGVTLTTSCSDSLSGVASCRGRRSGMTTGTYTHTVKDNAGNSSTCSKTVYLQIQRADCKTCSRCPKAGCKIHENKEDCKNCGEKVYTKTKSSCGSSPSCPSGYRATSRWTVANDQDCVKGTLNLTDTSYHVSCEKTVCLRCRHYTHKCLQYHQNCPLCGCDSFGSWYNVGGCTKTYSTKCRNLYY